MKNSKIFIALGAVTLGIVSIFGTKPAKKFAGVVTAFAKTPFTNVIVKDQSITNKFTNNSALGTYKTIQLRTVNGTNISTLFTSATSNNRVYFRP